MNLQSKYSDLMLNLLVALAISLVVNFSYVQIGRASCRERV